MELQSKTYVNYCHQLSIPASLLYSDWDVFSYESYKKKCQQGRLVRTRMGKGKGNFALLSFHHLPEDIKKICIEKLGDYKTMEIQTIH